MADSNGSSDLDLLEWLASGERGCEEVMDAWHLMPGLPVWEDANVGDWSGASKWTGACREHARGTRFLGRQEFPAPPKFGTPTASL
jgi:hypothetical protein